MEINFDKSNRLAELIYDSYFAIDSCHFKGAFDLKTSKNVKLNTLYRSLVEIQADNLSTDEKYKRRVEKFAETYGYKGDFEKGEAFLLLEFDEKNVLERLTKAYWQISPIRITFTGNVSESGLKNFIDKYYSEEPCKKVIIETILKQEPTEIEIEKEFWKNCTSVGDIDSFCNIYREHLGKRLLEVDEAFYEMDRILFDKSSLLYKYFKELRNCGFVSCSEKYLECRLIHIAKAINLMTNNVVSTFKKLRASTKPMVSNTSAIEEFLYTFCKGILILQQDERKQKCSENIVENIRLEAPFQIFFRSLFGVNYECCDNEVEKGNKRIDLKLEDSEKLPHRIIIEFKGWWNRDKYNVVEQCLSYMTDFEDNAVIFMINHLDSCIERKYKERVVLQRESYIIESWTEIPYKQTDYMFFKSKHTFNNRIKTLYHFIVSPKIYCKN